MIRLCMSRLNLLVLISLIVCGCSGTEVRERYYAIAGGEAIVVMKGRGKLKGRKRPDLGGYSDNNSFYIREVDQLYR